MQQLNNLPVYPVPLNQGKSTSKDWYFFWAGLYTGLPPSLPKGITVGASPFTYSPSAKGFVIIEGGTVSDVSFTRDGTNVYSLTQTAGQFVINANDQLIVTYSGLPTMTFVPT